MQRLNALIITIACGAFLSGSIFSPTLRAGSAIQQTLFTFRSPVAVPGKVLPAGTYLFRRAQSGSEMNVVEIKNPAETKSYGVFLVKPEFHVRVPKKSTLIFKPGAPGSPEAIKAWYFQGSKYFNDFLYPAK